MRILHWSSLFPPDVGGIETQVSLLAQEQVRRGHTVAVITSHTGRGEADVFDVGGVEVHRWPLVRAFMKLDLVATARLRKELAGAVKSFQADVQHLHLPGTIGFFAEPLVARAGLPFVTTMHAAHDQYIQTSKAFHLLVRASRGVAAVSRAALEASLEIYGLERGRIALIENGLPIEAAAPLPVGVPHHVVALGRLVRDKGFDVFLEAIALLVGQGHDVIATVAGVGPEVEGLAAQAKSLGLESRLRFPGALVREQVLALYREASVVAMPSRWEEPFGLVALEAQIAGRPVVASRVGGLPEFVIDEVTGLLVPKEDPAALARAIARLLGDPPLVRRVTAAAREAAIARFSVARCAREYDALYAEAIPEATA